MNLLTYMGWEMKMYFNISFLELKKRKELIILFQTQLKTKTLFLIIIFTTSHYLFNIDIQSFAILAISGVVSFI